MRERGTACRCQRSPVGALFTPAAKFVICKRGMPFVAEAMEVLGGIGYCEESELLAALPGDAGKQYLGRFRQYYVPGCVRVLD
ncbi:hypothetical protein ACVXHB_00485 [Escherichia coli]